MKRTEPKAPYRAVTAGAAMLLAATIGVATWGSPALSKPEYLSEFNKKYDTAGTRLDSCQTCHASTSPRADNLNPYGTDFGKANHDFGAVEGLDSDGDGFSNIDEIKALTRPGDPKENPNAKPEPPPKPSTTTTTAKPSPIPALPKLPIG